MATTPRKRTACACRAAGWRAIGPKLAAMSLVSLFALLLIVGVALLGIAALVALVLLVMRGRSVES